MKKLLLTLFVFGLVACGKSDEELQLEQLQQQNQQLQQALQQQAQQQIPVEQQYAQQAPYTAQQAPIIQQVPQAPVIVERSGDSSTSSFLQGMAGAAVMNSLMNNSGPGYNSNYAPPSRTIVNKTVINKRIVNRPPAPRPAPVVRNNFSKKYNTSSIRSSSSSSSRSFRGTSGSSSRRR